MSKELVHYEIYTEHKNGLRYYTLVDSDTNSLIVYTSDRSIVDRVIELGLRRIIPRRNTNPSSRRRV